MKMAEPRPHTHTSSLGVWQTLCEEHVHDKLAHHISLQYVGNGVFCSRNSIIANIYQRAHNSTDYESSITKVWEKHL